jgi:hypothetical protein
MGHVRCDFLEKLQPFAADGRFQIDESGDIAARPRKAQA